MVKHDLDATRVLLSRGVLRGSTTAFASQAVPVMSTFIADCGGIQTAQIGQQLIEGGLLLTQDFSLLVNVCLQ